MLLCVVNTLSGQCVVAVKCMSHAMYCVIIIQYSVFNDLQAPRCDFESGGGVKISKWGSMSDGTLRGYFVLK